MFPIIPLLALAGIIGGVSALAWYSSLDSAEQVEADRKAMAWFGRRFKELSDAQQARIRDELNRHS
jgi:hypothetical protein